MKHKQILLFLFVIALFCNSCKDKLFDFDLHEVEADGEWGIPVYNGTISMEELLSRLDSVQYIQTDADGRLKIVFEQEAPDIVSLSQVFNIEDQHFDTSGVATIGAIPTLDIENALQFSLSTEEVILKEGVLKSGTLSLFFNIQATDLQYVATLRTDDIRDAANNPMTITIPSSQQQQAHEIDLTNYRITPNAEGNIVITASIHVESSYQAGQDLHYTCNLALRDIVIKSIRGQFKAVNMDAIDESVGFKLPLDKIFFNNIGLNESDISIFAKNSLCEFSGSIDELYLYNNHGGKQDIITSTLPVFCPVSPLQYTTTPIAEAHIPRINYDPSLDSIKFKCNLTVNPSGIAAGDIYVDENSSLSLKIKAELPANVSIDNAVYNDTVDNSLYQSFNISTIDPIEKLTLRIVFINTFPFDAVPSIDFWDSQTGDKYHVELNGLQIHGAYGNVPYVHNPVYIEFTQEDAKKIINHDKIILNFQLNTQNHDVIIDKSQYIHAIIGAKVKYSNIHF